MKKLITQLALLLCSFSMTATVVTWNGGTGNWDDATMWSSGSVPNLVDSVIIGNGGKVFIPIGFGANALHVTVEDTLKIKNNASLNIINSSENGMLNNGLVTNNGTLSFSGTGRDALFVNGKFMNYANGRVTITSCLGGIDVEIGGLFRNSGSIYIDDISNAYGLDCGGEMVNKAGAIIDIYNSSGFRAYGTFQNFSTINVISSSIGFVFFNGDFFNESTGILTIDGCRDGLYCSSQLTNEGIISIDNVTEEGIFVYLGTLWNKGSGEISLSNVGTTGFVLLTGGRIINNGDIELNGTVGSDAISLTGSTIENDGKFTLNTTMPCVIDATSFFYNEACGTFNLDGAIDNDNFFENNGWLKSSYTGTHINTGVFLNNGIIGDLNDSFNGVTYTNSAVRVAPLNTTGTEGVAIPNALDLGSLTGFQVISDKWYTDSGLTTEAGDYDPLLNEFTPVAAAVGLSIFYMRIRDINNSCRSKFQIEITGGVVAPGPTTPVVPPFDKTLSSIDYQTPNSISIYPNPATEDFTITTSTPFAGKTTWSIYNLQGQRLQSNTVNAEGQSSFTIQRNNRLLPGVYLLEMQSEGQAPVSQRLMLN